MSDRPLRPSRGHRAHYPVLRESARYATLLAALLVVGPGQTPSAVAQDPPPEMEPLGGIVAPPTMGQTLAVDYWAADGTQVYAEVTFHAYDQRALDVLFLDRTRLEQVVVGVLDDFYAAEAAGYPASAQLLQAVQGTFSDKAYVSHVTVNVVDQQMQMLLGEAPMIE